MDNLKQALQDYLSSKENPRVELADDGTFRPMAWDVCPLCADAHWSCNTGAHLKQPEHYALKYGIDVKTFLRASEPIAFGPSHIAWKKLQYIESSYLVSHHDFKWIPETVTYAKCDRCDVVPGPDCSCGLYFFWSPLEAKAYAYDVLVKCEIGGNIEEATLGCRAECAVIRGVYCADPHRAELVSEMYHVPVITDLLEDYNVRSIDVL